jgi:CRISPR system Cascade subunit CasD
MSTLLLRLCGPMQSWGTYSRFSIRDTGLEPSKSGVLGLLCAALGKPRLERPGDGFPTLATLSRLKLGVRVDQEGWVRRDFHTAGGGPHDDCKGRRDYGVIKADGSKGGTVTSARYYLADADFLVGLEGDRGLLEILDQALQRPVWQLYLGRKSFVPSKPIRLPEKPPLGPSLVEATLFKALESHPWPEGKKRLRLVLETAPGEGAETRKDVPLDFERRSFDVRTVRTDFIERGE